MGTCFVLLHHTQFYLQAIFWDMKLVLLPLITSLSEEVASDWENSKIIFPI